MIRYLLPIAALGLLAACGDDPAPSPDDDDRTASGEILEGTISDAMLPVDRVRSEPPLLRPAAPAAGGGSSATAEETAEEDGEAEAAETPEASAEPAPPAVEDEDAGEP